LTAQLVPLLATMILARPPHPQEVCS